LKPVDGVGSKASRVIAGLVGFELDLDELVSVFLVVEQAVPVLVIVLR
jgi:hypothetical protein